MRIFFAGSEAMMSAFALKKAGVTNILESAFSLHYKKQPNKLKFDHYLLDSGGYSLRQSGKSMSVDAYCNYVNTYPYVDYTFNLDTSDVEETVANQQFLDQRCNSYVIPVYHYSDYVDSSHRTLLDYYLSKGYPFISVAPVAAPSRKAMIEMLDYVFARTKGNVYVHGLAVTNHECMMRYPFYSVDSTSWMVSEQYGQVIQFDAKGLRLNRIDSLKTQRQKGVEFKKIGGLTASRGGKILHNIQSFLKFEKTCTEMWRSRNVRWDDDRLLRLTREFVGKGRMELQNR